LGNEEHSNISLNFHSQTAQRFQVLMVYNLLKLLENIMGLFAQAFNILVANRCGRIDTIDHNIRLEPLDNMNQGRPLVSLLNIAEQVLVQHFPANLALQQAPSSFHLEFIADKNIAPGPNKFNPGKFPANIVQKFSHFPAKQTGNNDPFWFQLAGSFAHNLGTNQASPPKH
jgi:hypothetical protein